VIAGAETQQYSLWHPFCLVANAANLIGCPVCDLLLLSLSQANLIQYPAWLSHADQWDLNYCSCHNSIYYWFQDC